MESYYLCKVNYELYDEKAEKNKLQKFEYLIKAVSVMDAETKMNQYMKDSVAEFEVVSVVKSKISDVII